MIVDLIGPNCVGKTTVIEELQRRKPVKRITLLAGPPGRTAIVDLYLRVPPHIRSLMLMFVIRRRIDLAVRVAYFYLEQLRHGTPANEIGVRDEGFIKKLFEAVPFASTKTTQRAERFWKNVTTRSAEQFLSASLEGADLLVFAQLDEGEYLSRVRQRQFSEFPEETILERYRIQQTCFSALMNVGHRLGKSVCRINFHNAGDAADKILATIENSAP